MTESKRPEVILEPEAYTKALLHVLRFASNSTPQDAWVEVYGWLIGKLEENNEIVHVFDAIPIHHGKDVEVVWDADTYVRASEFDEKLFERAQEDPNMKGMFVVGWYHSHPGMDFFLSSTDVNNHLGFQGTNPKSIAIVFDHTKATPYKHLGFKIFKLDDPGVTEKFHEVSFAKSMFTKDVLDVVYILQSILERAQSNQLLYPEIGERPTIFSHLLLPQMTPELDRTPPLDLDALFSKMMKSTQSMVEKVFGGSLLSKFAGELTPIMEEWFTAFLPYMVSSMNKWLLKLSETIVISNKLSLGSLNKIQTVLEKSMKAVNEWTAYQLDEHKAAIRKSLDDKHAKTVAMVKDLLGKHSSSVAGEIKSLNDGLQKLESATRMNQETSDALGRKQDETASKLQNLIAGTGKQFSVVLERVGAIESRVAGSESATLAGIQSGLNQSSQQLDIAIKALDGSFKGEVQVLKDALSAEQTHVSSLKSALATALKASHEGLGQQLDNKLGALDATLKGEVQQVKAALSAEEARMGTFKTQLGTVLRETSERTAQQLDGKLGTLDASLKGEIQKVKEALLAQESRIKALEGSITTMIQSGLERTSQQLEGKLGALDSALKGEIMKFKESLSAEVTSLRANLQKELQGITGAVTAQLRELEQANVSKTLNKMQKDLERITKQ